MIKVVFNELRCNTCNDSIADEGVIVQEKVAISGRITQLCLTCSKFFRTGFGVTVVMEWRETR